MEGGSVGGLKRALSILPRPFWALTVSWFVAWDKALNLCVSKNKWWILSHLHCLLADGSCTWLTALFPHFLDLKMPASWGVAMRRRIACRASEEVSGKHSMGDSGCCWNSLDFWANAKLPPYLPWRGGESCKSGTGKRNFAKVEPTRLHHSKATDKN